MNVYVVIDTFDTAPAQSARQGSASVPTQTRGTESLHVLFWHDGVAGARLERSVDGATALATEGLLALAARLALAVALAARDVLALSFGLVLLQLLEDNSTRQCRIVLADLARTTTTVLLAQLGVGLEHVLSEDGDAIIDVRQLAIAHLEGHGHWQVHETGVCGFELCMRDSFRMLDGHVVTMVALQ